MADKIDLGGGAFLKGMTGPSTRAADINEVLSSGLLGDIATGTATAAEPQHKKTATMESRGDHKKKEKKVTDTAETTAVDSDFALSAAKKFIGEERLELKEGTGRVDPFLFTEASDSINFVDNFEVGKDLLIVTGVKGDYVLDDVLGGTLLMTKDTDLAIYVANTKPEDVRKGLVGSLGKEISLADMTDTDADSDSDASGGGTTTPKTNKPKAKPMPVEPDGGIGDGAGAPVDAGSTVDISGNNDPDSMIPKMMRGTEGMDVLLGGVGKDIILAGAGDDIIMDDAGDDIVLAGAGDDIIMGGPGKDFLFGDTGNDTFYLMEGEGTRANGGRGDDNFIIGQGDFEITGGGGKDTYTMDADATGKTRITDFRVGEDKLELDSKAIRLVEEANGVTLENNGQVIVELAGLKLTNELKDSISFLGDASA